MTRAVWSGRRSPRPPANANDQHLDPRPRDVRGERRPYRVYAHHRGAVNRR